MKNGAKLTDALDHGRSKAKTKRHFVLIGGVRYSLHRTAKSPMWRVRKRSAGHNVDFSTGRTTLPDAEEEARRVLGTEHELKNRLRTGGATLREVCDTYKAMPKRCSEEVANANIKRLERVVSVAWDVRLEDVKVSRMTDPPWADYAASRQGGKLDLSTRRHENRGINAALRMAVSIFHKGLEAGYRKAGITLDFEAARRVQWLPIIPSRLPVLEKENQDKLMEALPALKESDRAMWRAIMIARFAGLRSVEISASRKSWLKENSAGVLCFEVRDRPEENWWHKTGEDYRAPILSKDLKEDLEAFEGDGFLIPVNGSRDHFFRHKCNKWLRQFIPRPNKGLHRLRALYAEAMKDATAKAVLAEQAGIEAARAALGHTTTTTTTNSYLPS